MSEHHRHESQGENRAVAVTRDAPRPIEVSAAGRDGVELRRRTWSDWHPWREEIPSWVISLVLHLVVFLLLASMATPYSGGGRGPRGEGIVLTIELADRESRGGDEEIVIPLGNPDGEASAVPPPKVNREPTPEPATVPPSSAAQPSDPPRSQFQQWVAQTMADESYRPKPSKYAALLNRASAARAAANAPTPSPSLTAMSDGSDTPYDKVVDDFIEYDIGQLRGEAGQTAKERFLALGPDAIPAVVRGLNKSAGIHASCPVGVLAGKLINLLREPDGESFSRYAVDNLGVGVPESAPHYSRLMALRKHWLPELASISEDVASLITERGLNDDGELVELVLALTESPIDTVMASLRSGDGRLTAAAVIAIMQNPRGVLLKDRQAVTVELTELATNCPSQAIRSLATDALESLRRHPARAEPS